METRKLSVLINGAGVSGLALALSLDPNRFSITLTDKRDIQKNHSKEGCSINFTLTGRGLTMIKKLQIKENILQQAIKLSGRKIHKQEGKSFIQKYSAQDNHIYSIQRTNFIEILFNEIFKRKNINYQPNLELIKIEKGQKKATFIDQFGALKIIGADLIIGADGVFSKVRDIAFQAENISFEQSIFEWKYSEIMISSEDARKLKLSLNFIDVFPGKTSILIAIPNKDGSLSALLLAKDFQEDVFKRDKLVYDTCQAMNVFSKNFNQIKKSNLISLELSKWVFNDSIALIGDACHAVFPFYGQGMNSALEDALELAKQLSSNNDLSTALNNYERNRIQSAMALNYLSKNHFNILLKSAGKSIWNVRNYVDILLARLLPNTWVYEYEQVAHTNKPYDAIYKQIKKQNRLRYFSGLFILEWIFASFFKLN